MKIGDVVTEAVERATGREISLTFAEAITHATRAKREADEKIASFLGVNALWLATQAGIIQQALDAMVMIEFYRWTHVDSDLGLRVSGSGAEGRLKRHRDDIAGDLIRCKDGTVGEMNRIVDETLAFCEANSNCDEGDDLERPAISTHDGG